MHVRKFAVWRFGIGVVVAITSIAFLTLNCDAQVSSLDGAHWIELRYDQQPDGSLKQLRQVFDRRGHIALEFSLQDETVSTELLQLNSVARKEVSELLTEFEEARRDPSQGFGYDPRSNDWAGYVAGSRAWQVVWRDKLKQTLGERSLTKLDQATTRWMFKILGIERVMHLHLGHEPLLGMSSSQQHDLQALCQSRRKELVEQNRLSYHKHLEIVLSVLTAEQKAIFNQDYAEFLNSLQIPLELLMFQLSLSESDELVKKKLSRKSEEPDAWLALPKYYTLKLNGGLHTNATGRTSIGERKMSILENPQMTDVLDVSTNQTNELRMLYEEYKQQIADSEAGFSRRHEEAMKLHQIDRSNPSYSSAKESKITRELMEVVWEEHDRINRAFARDIDQILVPKQVQFLEILAARSELMVFGVLICLRNGRLGADLKITERQSDLLKRLQDKQLEELKKEAERQEKLFFDEWMKILTPKQQEEWEEMYGSEHDFYQPAPNLLMIEPSRY